MKFIAAASLAAVASAIVVPDAKVWEQIALEEPNDDSSWLSKHLPSKESIVSSVQEKFDLFSSKIEHAADSFQERLQAGFEDAFSGDEGFDFAGLEDRPHHGHPGKGRRPHKRPSKDRTNETIWQAISGNKHTSRFAEVVEHYDDLVQLLNSTEANHTLFVPINSAFPDPDKIPDDKKPSKEYIKKVLEYHIAVGLQPAHHLIAKHTIPTVLKEELLGDKPQRLRTRVGFFGINVDFFAKVIAADFVTKNGVIHGINHILLPPTHVGKELSLFPQYFSTLLLAYEKSDFVSFIHDLVLEGSTVFAPSNDAWKFLGPRANAFLFNTETGHKYLKAILKYHIIANQTVYSDHIYSAGKEDVEVEAFPHKHYHLDLPTLLNDKPIAIDFHRLGPILSVFVNKHVSVSVQDALAKNGVIQVVNRVLIPPHKHGKSEEAEEADANDDISVEDLIERLQDYVEEESWVEDL